MINNLKIRKSVVALMLGASITGCGYNKQVVDLNKAFNVAIESNGDSISVIPLKGYDDYEGSQVQFETNDNMVVLSSTKQLQLVKVNSESSLNAYTESLKDNNDEINYYSKDIKYGELLNKNLVDLNYKFNKAIILNGETVTILSLKGWNDYEDDKIQLILEDGTVILTNIDNVKLIYDKKANEDSVYNYASTLTNDVEKIRVYSKTK